MIGECDMSPSPPSTISLHFLKLIDALLPPFSNSNEMVIYMNEKNDNNNKTIKPPPPPRPPPIKGPKKVPPISFLSVTSTNIGISPKKFLTFCCNSFATLV